MTAEPRCRPLAETLRLARQAGAAAGITRVSDVTAFAVPGIPVFQATRPASRSLAVSQGKGLTATAAVVGALLESSELWTAENLPPPVRQVPLSALGEEALAAWSGPRDPAAIDLDPAVPRAWLTGEDLVSGRSASLPWELLSLDFTGGIGEYPATSVGLATGNSRSEALLAGVAEVLEHHAEALFDRLSSRQKLAAQIVLDTIEEPVIRRLLDLIARAGFLVKAWSMANDCGFPAVMCALFRSEASIDSLAPAAGTGCHPSAKVAFLRALLEAVQSRAGLVAGARDDVSADEYGTGAEREVAAMFAMLAFGDGQLHWRDVTDAGDRGTEHGLAFLLGKAEEVGGLPIFAFDHRPPAAGLHVTHVLAPGLFQRERRRRPPQQEGTAPVRATVRGELRPSARKLLFAGPSIAGLSVPQGVDVLPPARCGDLAALLADPPAAVALVDGYFKLAPTVWHKEILSLLAAGTRVIGGASLGALRAVELAAFGMEGIGSIFHAYRAGAIVRDDAVMLVHAPAEFGYAPLSVPLVDAEHALLLATLPDEARRVMQRIVRRARFETRTWPRCLEEYTARTGQAFPLSAEALAFMPSLKRIDAARVIGAIAEPAAQPACRPPAPPLTGHYRVLLDSVLATSPGRASRAALP